MKKRLWAVFFGLLSTVLLLGCSKRVHGGNPALPLSTTNGTTAIFHAPEGVVLNAISNAFATSDDNPMGYRGMTLTPVSVYSSNRGLTNGLELFPLMGPIATVPLAGGKPKSVPYIACFNIATKPLDNTQAAVTVRTVFSKVTDGKEASIHIVGMANHDRDVPPVKAEEENVLDAISNALISLHGPEEPHR